MSCRACSCFQPWCLASFFPPSCQSSIAQLLRWGHSADTNENYFFFWWSVLFSCWVSSAIQSMSWLRSVESWQQCGSGVGVMWNCSLWVGFPGRVAKPLSRLRSLTAFLCLALCSLVVTLCLGVSPSQNPTWREKAKLPMQSQFLVESVFCSGFLPFCIKCYTGIKGGDRIKPEGETAGPQQIQSALVAILLILPLGLGHAGSFMWTSLKTQNS